MCLNNRKKRSVNKANSVFGYRGFQLSRYYCIKTFFIQSVLIGIPAGRYTLNPVYRTGRGCQPIPETRLPHIPVIPITAVLAVIRNIAVIGVVPYTKHHNGCFDRYTDKSHVPAKTAVIQNTGKGYVFCMYTGMSYYGHFRQYTKHVLYTRQVS